jgi:ABC-type bacteriocin/lantibiotic exporter with double-glycine peptidase domain
MINILKTNKRNIVKTLFFQKQKIIFLCLSMIVIIILEFLSISIFLPFLDILFSQADIAKIQGKLSREIYQFLLGYNFKEIIVILSFLLMIIFIVKNLLIIFLNYLNLNLLYNFQQYFHKRALDFFYNKKYEDIQSLKSSDVVRDIVSEPKNIIGYFSAWINIIIESLLVLLLLLLLLLSQPKSILVLLVLVFIGILTFILTYKKLNKWGYTRFKSSSDVLKFIMLPFSNNAEIKILKLESFFKNAFNIANIKLQRTGMNMTFVKSLNKNIFEVFFIIIFLFSLILVAKYSNSDLENSMGSLSLLFVIALRVIPSINKIISAFQAINFTSKSISHFESTVGNYGSNLNFENPVYLPKFINIFLDNISFKYKDKDKLILHNIFLKIQKGDKIAISGDSGSGKSTLVKLIAGLLEPSSGKIFLNEKETSFFGCKWEKSLVYVSQKSFIFNGTLLENITLDFEKKTYDINKINKIVNICDLEGVFGNLENKIYEEVKDGGSNFSSGQIQRIAIARSLYCTPDILILDEATNALDKKSQDRIIKAILNIPDLTVICVSHDEQILNYFKKIYKFSNGKITN